MSETRFRFPDALVSGDWLERNLSDPALRIFDCTTYLHSGENPRYGRAGRIPGSKNVPARSLVNLETMELLSADEVANAFAAIGADTGKRTIVYCGGGIAATMDAYVLTQLGYADVAVYDNSMSEWAADATLPIEKD